MRLQIKYILLISFLVTALSPLTAIADGINWYKYNDGIKAGKKENKKIYIYFHSKRCPWCTKMEKEVFSKDEVIKALNKNFIPIKVNVAEEYQVAKKYGIQPIPAHVFLESDIVSQIYKRPGYIQSNVFENILEAITLEKYK